MLRLALTLVLLSTACATARSPTSVVPVPTVPAVSVVVAELPPVLRPQTSGRAWVDVERGVVFAPDAHGTLVAFDGQAGKELFRVADFSDSSGIIAATGPFLYSAASSRGGKVRLAFVEPASGQVQTCQLTIRVPLRANALSVFARATASGIQLVWNASDEVRGGPRREADPAASACGEFAFDPRTCATGDLSAKQSGSFPCMDFVSARGPRSGVPVDEVGGVKLKVDRKVEGPADCGGFTHWFLSGVRGRELWRRELATERMFCPIP